MLTSCPFSHQPIPMETRGEGSPLMQVGRSLRRGALEVGGNLGEGGVPGDQGANEEEVKGGASNRV